MLKTIKRLPPLKTLGAIAFLFVQIICSLILPYITADIINKGVIMGDTSFIWSRGGLMIGLSLLSLVGAVFNTLLFSQISYNLGGDLRSDIYRKALRFSKKEYDQFGASSLITRNTNDVTQVQTLVEMGCKFLLLAPAYLVGGIIMTSLLSPKLALVFLSAIPFLVVAYLVIYKFASPLYVKMQKLIDKLNLYFKEGLTGAKVIRAFGKEEEEYEKYREVNREYTGASIKAGTIMSFFFPVITMLISLATLIIVWISGHEIAAGTMQVGSIVGATSYAAQILMGFAMLTQVILSLPRGQTSASRIYEVLDMPLSVDDPANAGIFPRQEPTLTFEDVDFRYSGAVRKTLSGVNLVVHGGQTLAVIGSTGDGKTSLINLISRLYDVEKGHVRLNGADVRDVPQKALHEKISFAPQASTLFFGTIRSNMLIGKPDATDSEIWAALDMAQATEFISCLDKGLDSAVEKAGGNFSGGQKQRLCIARALLKNADVYVFDDSFSALDYMTDAAVRGAMREKTQNAVTVIVAQRVSTVMRADIIAVLDGGALAGLGTHEELLEGNAVYRQIVDSQVYREVS